MSSNTRTPATTTTYKKSAGDGQFDRDDRFKLLNRDVQRGPTFPLTDRTVKLSNLRRGAGNAGVTSKSAPS